MKRILLIFFILIVYNANSQDLVNYNFTGLSGVTASVSPNEVHPSLVSASSLSRGAGLNAESISNGYNSSNWSSSTSRESGKYLEFSLTTDNNHTLLTATIQFTVFRSTNGPQSVEVTTLEGGASETSRGVQNSIPASTNTLVSFSFSFYTNNAATTTFRIYGFNAVNGVGTMRLLGGSTASWLKVTGTVPLPVNLTNFTGKNKPTSISLNWATTSETNFSHFIVQKSKDAKGFENIGRIESAGFESKKNEYSFIDEKPFAGNNYYRLRMVDKDGTEDYSKMISVNFDGKTLAVFYPNPTQDFVRFENIKTEDISSVVVHNINGEFLGEILPTDSGLDISAFKSRELILQLNMKNSQTLTSRIIKNL